MTERNPLAGSSPGVPETRVTVAPQSQLNAYARYFLSGQYDRRYPAPNPRVLTLARQLLPPGGHLLDYGCGSGRYLLNLAGQSGCAAGFDISPEALSLLTTRASENGGPKIAVLGPALSDLEDHMRAHGPADLILCIFGVLSHITDPAERRLTLRRLRDMLRPANGRLVISVPNHRRRLLAEQRHARLAGNDGLTISYRRHLEDGEIVLGYHLFSPADLRCELENAGLVCQSIVAESLLPESWIVRHATLARADGMLARLIPPALGYGLLAVARRDAVS